MSLLSRLFGKQETRSDRPYRDFSLETRQTMTGQYVTAENATGVPAVHACVQLIAETTASLPLSVYRRTSDGGREIDSEHPLHRVLHDQPNSMQTAMEFREQLVAAVLLTGNGYAKIATDLRGQVTGLEPLHPGYMTIGQLPNGRLRYKYQDPAGRSEVLLQEDVLHVRYRSVDGITGLSPLTIARETIGIALAHQETEGNMHRNGVRLSGVLTVPGLVPDKRKLRQEWATLYRGTGRAGHTAVLEKGMDYKTISLSPADAQFVDSRKLNLEDIARIFRVPPPSIGILDKATYSNISEQSRSLVMHTLRPWLVRLEQAMNTALLSPEGQRTHFVEHNFEGLLRGSQKERFESYAVGRQWGWLSTNEVRSKENLSPISEGDDYLSPLNMTNSQSASI